MAIADQGRGPRPLALREDDRAPRQERFPSEAFVRFAQGESLDPEVVDVVQLRAVVRRVVKLVELELRVLLE